MDNVSFLQQQLDEILRQMTQLDDKRRKLHTELYAAKLLQRNNLKKQDDPV